MIRIIRPQYYLPFIAIALYGCSISAPPAAKQPGRITNYTVCQLPKDQGEGSFQGKWITLPVTVVIDRDFYLTDQSEQASQIRAAIQSWNTWAGLRGLTAFTISNDGSGLGAGAAVPVTTDCSQATITNARTDVVGIWKIQAGGDGKNTRIVNGEACKLLATGIQGKTDWSMSNGFVTGASILFNFDEFNTGSSNKLDLQSLALHELGHVLGLLHSCNGGGGDTSTSPACGSAQFRYTEAVMFPFLLANQFRRILQQNDYSRINCLY